MGWVLEHCRLHVSFQGTLGNITQLEMEKNLENYRPDVLIYLCKILKERAADQLLSNPLHKAINS